MAIWVENNSLKWNHDFSVHDDYIFVLMIITLIKMVNADALSSQNVNCSLSNFHTLVDLYLFMWRETVDFRVAKWFLFVCKKNHGHESGKTCLSLLSCPEQLNRWPCHCLTHWLTDSVTHGILLIDIQKVTQLTCDLWEIWSDWWGDITWPKQQQWQRQRQRQWQRQIHEENSFKERS